ncbi:hypothetical protein VPH35_101579 [Triticum aestivum]
MSIADGEPFLAVVYASENDCWGRRTIPNLASRRCSASARRWFGASGYSPILSVVHISPWSSHFVSLHGAFTCHQHLSVETTPMGSQESLLRLAGRGVVRRAGLTGSTRIVYPGSGREDA